MRFEDRVRISTPEGIELDLPLAGLGSRLAAALIDQLIQAVVILALAAVVLVPAASTDLIGPAVAVWITLAFLVQSGYHVAFEVLASGRTPGKRRLGVRVVRDGGGPVSFRTSAVRNLLRLIDVDLTLGAAGTLTLLVTRNNQRLGDLAAGTLVVRERAAAGTAGVAQATAAGIEGWDVGGVSDDELSTVRLFLERRGTLQPGPRAMLAAQLASRLRPKVVGPHAWMDPEAFIEALAAAKSSRG